MRPLITCVAGIAYAVLPGCGRAGSGPDAVVVADAAPPFVHRRAFEQEVKTFDPANAGDAFAGEASLQVHEPLFEFDPFLRAPLTLRPLTAASMPAVSADGRVYTITVKPGVRFHDDACFAGGGGRELRAADFVYAWKRLADPATRTGLWGMFAGKIVGLDEWRERALAEGADYDADVTGLRAVGPLELRIELTRADPRFRLLLAMPCTAAVPREAVAHYGDAFGEHPVGTGAYRLVEWIRGSRFVLERHPRYHEVRFPADGSADAGRRLPLCDRVEVSVLPEAQPRWLQFQAGRIDFIQIPKDVWTGAVRDGGVAPELAARGITLTRTPLLDVSYTVFSMTDPILGVNKLLRRAIACAVDRETEHRLLLNGRGVPAESPIPPGLFGHDGAYRHPNQRHDLERARRLLAEAGYPKGAGLPPLRFEMHGTASEVRAGAELFQHALAGIGIRVQIEANTWPAFMQKVEDRRAQIFGIGWGADYPDPENFLQLLYGPNAAPNGANAACWQHDEYDRLYEAVAVMDDTPERSNKIRRMIDIFAEEQPWILGFHRDAWVLHQPWCHNYKYPVIGGGYFKYVRVDPVERARRLGE